MIWRIAISNYIQLDASAVRVDNLIRGSLDRPPNRRSVLCRQRWRGADRDLIGDGAAPFAPLLVDAQRQVQSAAGALVLIDARIDALVRDPGQTLDALMTGNLLRTPGFGQLLAGELPCGGGHAARVDGAAQAACHGQKARHLRLIGVKDTVAADGGGWPPQLGGDGFLRPASFFKAEIWYRSSWMRWQ
ncbi:MAG: hypothetical protein ABR991_07615 [Terracidiphilus sp.]